MDFYRISEEYIKFLQEYEKKNRGFTRVPNVCYSERSKFSFGAVLDINGMKYYVAVSSFDKKQEANLLIQVPGDEKEIKGSLRFNYMIPVPDKCVIPLVIKDESDEKYKDLLNKEYRFCKSNEDKIIKKANKIYEMVIKNKKQKLTDNSCDFIMLEKACMEYKNRNT